MALDFEKLEKGSAVWYEAATTEGPTPGIVEEIDHKSAIVRHLFKDETVIISEAKKIWTRKGVAMEVEDLKTLDEFSNSAVLWTLKNRYEKQRIYTWIGEILVAVNANEELPIYDEAVRNQYRNQKSCSHLPPHLFGVGANAHSKLITAAEDQCIIFSGESGSGKTESLKYLTDYLALTTIPMVDGLSARGSKVTPKQLNGILTILHSFGSARTMKNANASRFGLNLELLYKNGGLCGVGVGAFALEKWRLLQQTAGERNFHVFYQMLAGLDSPLKQKFGLLAPQNYFYLNQGGRCADGETLADETRFDQLRSSFDAVGLSRDQQHTVFRSLAAILHLGNVYFKMDKKDDMEMVVFGGEMEVNWVAYLLQLDPDSLRKALTQKTVTVGGETVSSTLTIDEALDARDALVRSLYCGLFRWIIARLNHSFFKPDKNGVISLIDFPGFERYHNNSFDQLAINLASERQHQFFYECLFKNVQEEYRKEKIEWTLPNLGNQLDNQKVLDLLMKRPVGIAPLLDDECKFPKGSDETFLQKCHLNHMNRPNYGKPRARDKPEFCVKHFNGSTYYTVCGFMEKNRDLVPPHLTDLLLDSQNATLSLMFRKDGGTKESAKPVSKYALSGFNETLGKLFDKVKGSRVHFVCCVRPNQDRQPARMDAGTAMSQIAALGLTDTAQMRHSGYPVVFTFKQFANRFQRIVPPEATKEKTHREITLTVLSGFGHRVDEQYQMGALKVFLKEALTDSLESRRDRLAADAALVIQKHLRRHLAANAYGRRRNAVLRLQAGLRGWQARNQYKQMRQEVLRVADEQARHSSRLQAYEELKRRAQQPLEPPEDPQADDRVVTVVEYLDMPEKLTKMMDDSRRSQQQQPTSSNGRPRNDSQPTRFTGGEYLQGTTKHALPQDLNTHTFEQFAEQYFKGHLWRMRREPITTPFLPKDADEDFEESLLLFKLVLRFMNDSTLRRDQEELIANYIAIRGILKATLRDELYCQIVNQTKENPNVANQERGWWLILACASSFPPSETLFKPLLNYLELSSGAPEPYKGMLTNKVLDAYYRESVAEHGAPLRRCPPSRLEHAAVRQKSKMVLEPLFTDGSRCPVQVDSWSSASIVAEQALRAKGISGDGWTVQLSTPTVELEIGGDDYLLDYISHLELPTGFPLGGRQAPRVVAASVGDASLPALYRLAPDDPCPASSSGDGGSSSGVPSEPRHSPQSTVVRGTQADEAKMPHGVPNGQAVNTNNAVPVVNGTTLPAAPPPPPPGMYSSIRKEDHGHPDMMYYPPIGQPAAVTTNGLPSRMRPNGEIVLNGYGQQMMMQSPEMHSYYDSQLSSTATDRSGPVMMMSGGQFPPSSLPSHLQQQQMHQQQMIYQSRYPQQQQQHAMGTMMGNRPNSSISGDITNTINPYGEQMYGRMGQPMSTTSTNRFMAAAPSEYSAMSVSSRIRRMPVPSRNGDVDRFLDAVFDPVLKLEAGSSVAPGGTVVEDAYELRSLAASIKGGGGADANEQPPAANQGPTQQMTNQQPAQMQQMPVMGSSVQQQPVFMMMPMDARMFGLMNNGVGQQPQMSAGAQQQVQFVPMQFPMMPFSSPVMAQSNTATPQPQVDSQMDSNRRFPQQTTAVRRDDVAVVETLTNNDIPSPPSLPPEPNFPPPPASEGTIMGSTVPRQPEYPPPPPPNNMQYMTQLAYDPMVPRPMQNDLVNQVVSDAIRTRADTVRIGTHKWPPIQQQNIKETADTNRLIGRIDEDIQGESRIEVHRTVDSAPYVNRDITVSESIEYRRLPPLDAVEPRVDYPAHNHHYRNNIVGDVDPQRGGSYYVLQTRHTADGQPINRIPAMPGDDVSHNIRTVISQARHQPTAEDYELSRIRQLGGRLPYEYEGGEMNGVREPSPTRPAFRRVDPTRNVEEEALNRLKEHSKGLPPPVDQVRLIRGSKLPMEESPYDVELEMIQRQRVAQQLETAAVQQQNVVTAENRPPNRSPVVPPGDWTHETKRPTNERIEQRQSMLREGNEVMQEHIVQQEIIGVGVGEPKGEHSPQLREKKRIPPAVAYNEPNWELSVRKELFFPGDRLDDAAELDAVFWQIVNDCYKANPFRIRRYEQHAMLTVFKRCGIEPQSTGAEPAAVSLATKRNVVDAARQWPLYFCRLYPVTEERRPGGDYASLLLAVGETGVRLIARNYDAAATDKAEPLKIIDHFDFGDLNRVEVTMSRMLRLVTRRGIEVRVFTDRAEEIKQLIDRYIYGPTQGKRYVVAVADYITKEPNLLSFKKGEIIQLVDKDSVSRLEAGGLSETASWLYGKLNGLYGHFPADYVEEVKDYCYSRMPPPAYFGNAPYQPYYGGQRGNAYPPRDPSAVMGDYGYFDDSVEGLPQPVIDDPSTWLGPPQTATMNGGGRNGMMENGVGDGKLTMMEFAMMYFRNAPRAGERTDYSKQNDRKGKNKEWTWKDVADQVKYSKEPLSHSLLRLESQEYDRLAVDAFMAILRYMGDAPAPIGKKQSQMQNAQPADCVYELLMICHRHPPMRDEVYCQIVKQTTNNKSPRQDSAIKGWRLFSILAAYFDCSDVLRPYLFKYLDDSASDSRRAYHGTALVCLQNLNKTFKYGGRKFLLGTKEIEAITLGKNLKRQIYHLPGGHKKVINTKAVTVVEEIIQDLCTELNIRSALEQQEFCLCYILEAENAMKLLANDDYVMDVTTELEQKQKEHFLLLKRTVWIHPLRLDNELYIDVMFFQLVPDYLEGLLVAMRTAESLSAAVMDDIAKLGALLHIADEDGRSHTVNPRTVQQLLPKVVQNLRHVTMEQWADRVNRKIGQLPANLSSTDARARFLEVLQSWPLFGSTFFYISKVNDSRIQGECLLAINRQGLQFLHIITHETLIEFRLSEVLSTHKVTAAAQGGAGGTTPTPMQFLDIKVGNLLQQKVITLQTEQGTEISRLLGQYIYVDSQNRGYVGNAAPANLAPAPQMTNGDVTTVPPPPTNHISSNGGAIHLSAY